MNRIAAAGWIMALTVALIGCHTYAIRRLDSDMNRICDAIEAHFDQEDWEQVSSGMEQLQNRWEKSRFWACLTIDTRQIEEMEISLRQSRRYAQLRAREDFIGEFIMFRMLAERLPHHEGFSLEELL